MNMLSKRKTLSLILFSFIMILGISYAVEDNDLQYEEQLFVNMLDKGHNKGFEAYQTSGNLFQFAQLFFDACKDDFALAECDKIKKKYPDETDLLLSVISLEQVIRLHQNEADKARTLIEPFMNDQRRVGFSTKRLFVSWLRINTHINFSNYYMASNSYDKAIDEYKKILLLDEEEAKNCSPQDKETPLWSFHVAQRIELGDIYRFAGQFAEAAKEYQHAWDYMKNNSIPKTGFPEHIYKQFKDKTLPQLISECTASIINNEIQLRRNVNYKYELGTKLKRDHFYEAVDKFHNEILETLKNNALLENLDPEKKSHYNKLKDDIMNTGSLIIRSHVDVWIQNARFNNDFFGKKDKTEQYLEKARNYLGTHSIPEFLSDKEKEKYEHYRKAENAELLRLKEND